MFKDNRLMHIDKSNLIALKIDLKIKITKFFTINVNINQFKLKINFKNLTLNSLSESINIFLKILYISSPKEKFPV